MTMFRLSPYTIQLLFFFIMGCSWNPFATDHLGDRKNSLEVVKNMPHFRLKVFYMPGAEPFTGQLSLSGSPLWSIMESTLGQILPPGVRQIDLPSSLAQMQSINLPHHQQWDNQLLSRLSQDVTFAQLGSEANTLSVVYLAGLYQPNPNAVGLHFSGRPVVFIFKPSVRRLQGSLEQQSIAEQAVLAHEVGHAIGLVNGRINMADVAHEDPTSAGHCSNPNCVMYKNNDGQSFSTQIVQQIRSTGNFSLFGQECLKDLSGHYSNFQ